MPPADAPGGIFYGWAMPKIYFRQEPPHVRGICLKCKKNPQKTAPNGKFRTLCSPCDRRRHAKTYRPKRYAPKYARNKGPSCVKCGFVPVHKCQLDVDHIDGDHANSAPDNLQTLCSNCHRLKTYEQRWGRKHEISPVGDGEARQQVAHLQ